MSIAQFAVNLHCSNLLLLIDPEHLKPFYHIIISIGVIMITAIITGLVFHYSTSKTANGILFVLGNIVFLAATIWIVINAIKMVKQGSGL